MLFFFYKKKLILGRFSNFLWPAFGHGRLGHPQSLEYLFTSHVKIWEGENCFAHGRFPEVGQKQKTEKKKKERNTEQW